MLNKLIKKILHEKGVSLVEVILILVIVSIAIWPLTRLTISNVKAGGRYSYMTRAISYAQNTLEEIIADYAAEAAGRGYTWVQSNWDGATSAPAVGFTTNVTVSSEDSLSGVWYVEVDVSVSGPDIDNITLSTWLINPN